ncbi:hypothetical protein HK101_003672 [Irineochytrium annulatum]|nr:hypothetical protein HK101_003672 [Irineochytrium annulatum]
MPSSLGSLHSLASRAAPAVNSASAGDVNYWITTMNAYDANNSVPECFNTCTDVLNIPHLYLPTDVGSFRSFCHGVFQQTVTTLGTQIFNCYESCVTSVVGRSSPPNFNLPISLSQLSSVCLYSVTDTKLNSLSDCVNTCGAGIGAFAVTFAAACIEATQLPSQVADLNFANNIGSTPASQLVGAGGVPPSSPTSSSSGVSKTVIIAAGAAGGVLLIIIIVVAILCVRRSKARQAANAAAAVRPTTYVVAGQQQQQHQQALYLPYDSKMQPNQFQQQSQYAQPQYGQVQHY